ncbi:MAG: hypothetical protein M0C28_33160 [Candidatus Moduliflexus flocculans]|nr:hypothetical protein [Candidatus Moduliflexus flocculans]
MIVLKDVLALLDGELLTPAHLPRSRVPEGLRLRSHERRPDLRRARLPPADGTGQRPRRLHLLGGRPLRRRLRPGQAPGPDRRRRGPDEGDPLMATKMTMFEACSRIAGFDRGRGHGRR